MRRSICKELAKRARLLCRTCLPAMLIVLFGLVNPGWSEALPVNVFVSIAPQKYFVERIGGDLVNVAVMVPPGASPHAYEPKPSQMRALTQARAYFALGVEFERVWLPRITATHPDLLIVHTDSGIEKIPMVPHHHDDASHDHGHGHRAANCPCLHHGLDSHIWLSPDLVRVQAGHILNALRDLDPANASVYEGNHARFMTDIDVLDAELGQILTKSQGKAFMVFHPAWGYFAKAYGLEQIPVEVEGKEPKAKDLKRLIDRAKERGITVVFVSPQFSARSAEMIASSINGQVVSIDPLAEDWLGNMRIVAEKFRAAVR